MTNKLGMSIAPSPLPGEQSENIQKVKQYLKNVSRVRLNANLPKKQYKKFKFLCAREGKYVGDVVIELVQKYIDSHENE